MRQKLSWRNLLLVGFTLFSMFFGAGNLIFPPFLGAEAGTLTWHAMRGFLLSAVGLPVLGVAAVAMAGGLDRLGRRVHPGFAFVFTLLIYLSIGPCLAIPRTASTSFEMAVLPYLGGLGTALGSRAQLIYSVVFFCIAMALAFRPDKLTDRLGKVLCPTLLILIAVIFTGCLIWPLGAYGAPAKEYADSAAVKGFLEGYQTMDTIAALNFGIIIALNIRAKGVQEDGAVVRETVKAGVIAGLLMAAVYVALAHIGAPAGAKMRYPGNGARILTFVADSLFGRAGMILLGMIFFIACLNTCVGLLSCCSEYFSTILPAVGYRLWVVVFAGVSLLISNAGLDRIGASAERHISGGNRADRAGLSESAHQGLEAGVSLRDPVHGRCQRALRAGGVQLPGQGSAVAAGPPVWGRGKRGGRGRRSTPGGAAGSAAGV